jgi:hypothetical protein
MKEWHGYGMIGSILGMGAYFERIEKDGRN